MMNHPHVGLYSSLHCSTCLGVFYVTPCLSDLGLQTQSPAEQACALLAAHKQPFLFQQHLSRLIMHAQVLCQPRNGHIF